MYEIKKMPSGLAYLVTKCVGACPREYSMDENHPEYPVVLKALEAGDRSVIFCYHKSQHV